MDGGFTGWRKSCGVATLLAALVLTGAWGKSVVEHSGMQASIADKVHSLPLSGKIAVSFSTNPIDYPGYLPQSNWQILGLYSDFQITIAPPQILPGLPDLVQSLASVPESLERLPSKEFSSSEDFFSEVTPGELLRGQLIQTAASQTVVGLSEPTESLSAPTERIGISSDFGPGPPFGVDIVDGVCNKEDQPEWVSSRWEFCGFRFSKGADCVDLSTDCVVLIPHWFLILPLLVSAGFLVRPGFCKSMIAATTTPAPVSASPNGKTHVSGTILHGWRGGCGIASLLVSCLLAAGWLRNSDVSDRVNLVLGKQGQLILVSGKEGLVCTWNGDLDPTGCRSGYRMITGKAHESMHFRPLGLFETIECNVLPGPVTANSQVRPLAGLDAETQDGSAELWADDLLVSHSDVMDFAVIAPDGIAPPREIEMSVATDAVALDSASPVSPAEGIAPPRELSVLMAPVATEDFGSGSMDFVGITCDWAGSYISVGPTDATLVVPYGLLVIPLALLSAGLLVRSRNLRALFGRSKKIAVA